MTDKTLEDELAAVVAAAAPVQVGDNSIALLNALESSSWEVSAIAAFRLNDLQKRIEPLLQADARFAMGATLMLRTDNGGIGFFPNFAATRLVHRAIKTQDVASSIAWLQRILQTPAAYGYSIAAIWGAPVIQRVELGHDIALVPTAELPNSVRKRWLVNPAMHRGPILSTLVFTPPESALIRRIRVEPLLVEPGAIPKADEYLANVELFSDITLALNVIGPRIALQAAQWFTFEDPDVEDALWGASSSHPHIEILPLVHAAKPPLDGAEVADTVSSFLQLTTGVRGKVRVALQRLGQAQRRLSVGDRAVEISVALETLLGDSATSEMTHKIKVRSVRMIGGSGEERRRNADIFSRTYDIRSKLVHTGASHPKNKMLVGGEQLPAEEIVTLATSLCAGIIKLILKIGNIPDWAVFDIGE